MPRLRLLSFTTELGIGASVYNSIYPRLCTIEYLLSVAMVIYLCAYAFCTLRVFCAKNIHHYLRDLLAPNTFLRRYNAIGYDKHVDSQWGRFTQQYTTLVELSAFMGATTFLCRCVSSTSMSRAPSTADSISSYDISQNGLAGTTNGAVTNIGTRGGRLPAESSASDVCASKPVSLALRVWRIIAGHSWSIPAFYTVTGFIFVAAVHGPHFFLPLLLIIANYVIFSRLQRLCPYWLFMATMWATHVAGLYIIEIANGFEGTYWLQYFFTTSADEALNLLGYEQKPLWDTNMRWAISFRMSTLRLISFNYDLWEATHAAARARERATAKHDATCIECAQLREQNAALAAALPAEASRCYKYRTEYPRDPADYNFVNYAAYTLFPPLYLGGPMSSFNAFVSYMRVPSTSMPLRKMVTYAFAIFRIYATTVLLLHFVHVPALAKHSYLITEMSLQEQAHFVFLTLAYLWLKFNFIWKSSRLFAMLSGIEVPEDMRRCFANTLTVRDFWRDWHASFNLWVVRYMYIPMGGSSRVALSVLPIFLFIALWHDPVLHLVKWALCIAVMFMAEVAVSGCFGWAVAAFRREMAAVAPRATSGEGINCQCSSRINSLARLARFLAAMSASTPERQLCSWRMPL
ncbi:putative glycerol uptake protein [Leishmania braziliensis MHOM/BR/75/M2904]|uniref:Glycerol uptake protein n=1 Tax=Leishmania braziliensis TaxID=5660 RepID=A4HA76_LEIBR|nr:putative glycerol uptake protein [Leishmania braziliensis MHOM/BR/75/M2904]CAM38304.1 putative glycerol uptake protein [Leishmania braziliensis MHOM/BR/75/M2904]